MVKLEIPQWLADEKRISFGQCQNGNIIAVFEKIRETEKAICVNDDMTGEIWLPKSQIQILSSDTAKEEKKEENGGYSKYGFELIDDNDREWEIIIKDSKKVKEIAKKLNYEQLNLHKVSCSIYEKDNTAVMLISSLKQDATFKMSIEELLEKIS